MISSATPSRSRAWATASTTSASPRSANIPQADVADQLAVGQFDDNLATVYGDFYTAQAPGTTCAMLSQFKLGEFVVPATDYVQPAGTQTITYMLVFTTGTTPAVGAKSMLFLEPSTTSTVTTVNAVDACAATPPVLSFQATLGQDMPISATDSSKWHVDWSQLTKDSFGYDVRFTKIDRVLIGFYQGKTKADLQTNFKDIEVSATTLYEVSVPPGARDVKLGDAKVRARDHAVPGLCPDRRGLGDRRHLQQVSGPRARADDHSRARVAPHT